MKKYSPAAVGSYKCQFSLQWVVFCWCTQKGRQIPPSWAQKQGTPEGEWTHSAEVESSLHLRCDCSWNILKGFSRQIRLLWISVYQFMSTLHSLNSKTNYLVGDEKVTASDCVPPLQKIDTHKWFRLQSFVHPVCGYLSQYRHCFIFNTDCFLAHRYSLYIVCLYRFKWVKCPRDCAREEKTY